ncbi:MAG: carbamoyltransferase HypF, partial [Holophagales bacterium]|nr:carbamoyltransferase HypF [Holophagales bacterium]
LRHRLTVSGVVQGVGFRPFVYGLARRLHLAGSVRNVDGGVAIELQGPEASLRVFRRDLVGEAPPLARIDRVEGQDLPPAKVEGFEIVASTEASGAASLVPADVALCAACREELHDPRDRRFRYPFVNCTDCGPRFSLITGTPYDRPKTTMAGFEQCPLCAAEYGDPSSRRFHAQPNACPGCGPSLEWIEVTGSRSAGSRSTGSTLRAEAALDAALDALDRGYIVAIKGLGGFHLACDATRDAVVERLRRRKARPHKPFAVMVPSLEEAELHARLGAGEGRLLTGRRRPIVLLERRGDSALSRHVAPGQPTVGLMLPYTPLHELLVAGRTLVMTSGNRAGEPICKEDAEALDQLSQVADGFLLHDRPIQARCDDSVVRWIAGGPSPVRRSRGWVPLPLDLPLPTEPLLAVGAELKNVFCLASGKRAFLGQHLGDLGSAATQEAFEEAVGHLSGLFRVQPEAVVCDLHPAYLSTSWAEAFARQRGLPLIRVQHHHAHVASLMAEHGLDGSSPVLGFAFDGTGFGVDGTIWGGEVLRAEGGGFERLAHLRAVDLPGGDA